MIETKTKCPLCLSNLTGEKFTIPESMFRTGKYYDYVHCQNCSSLVRQISEPTADDLYPKNYYSFASDPLKVFEAPLPRLVARVLSLSTTSRINVACYLFRVLSPKKELRSLALIIIAIRRALPRRRNEVAVLDVGTGSGVVPFTLSLNPRLTVTGIDPFLFEPRVVGAARLQNTDIFKLDGTWDLIMLHHSFEHVEDPTSVLLDIKSKLKEGGRVLIRVPTISSKAWQVFGTNWYQIDAPRHNFLASRHSLNALLTRSGFKIIREYDDSTGVQFWMSQYVAHGDSALDSQNNYDRYKLAPNRRVAMCSALKSYVLNRQHVGDQICVIAELES